MAGASRAGRARRPGPSPAGRAAATAGRRPGRPGGSPGSRRPRRCPTPTRGPGAGDPLPDDLSADHRSALARHLRQQEGEQDRTVVIKRITVLRATPRGSGNREYYLFRGLSGDLEVRARISDVGRGKAVAAVLAAVAVLVLVLLLVT
ncbi:hypothetical protein [Streptomyces sp. DH12]|uniref:hypothetical protein n=1 Tax=Streptomyces sp. DH12 TaxID=2857010 RepID=UPI001E36A893|nr:hypothetical protein [Streptomyces sp. DH12]